MQSELTSSRKESTSQDKTPKKYSSASLEATNREIAKILKKNLSSNMKSTKRPKLTPKPNLACARDKLTDDAITSQVSILEASQVVTNHLKQTDLLKILNETRDENQKLKQELWQKSRDCTQIDGKISSNFESSNRFSLLENDYCEMEEEVDNEANFSLIQKLKKKNTGIKENSQQEIQTRKNIIRNTTQSPNLQSKSDLKKKPPPINIFHQDPRDTLKLIKETLGNVTFHIKRINEDKHTLYINDIDNYNKTKNLLKETNTNFYSFTPKEEKNLTFILKGLNHTFEEKEILWELQNLNIEGLKFHKLSRFTTKRSIQEQRTLPIFIVQLTHDSKPGLLNQIKYIAHQVVHWEKLRRKDIIQCKRCQRLGHAAANCNLRYRCVKCKEDHAPGKCSIYTGKNNEPYCINCNSFGHPVFYRRCPKIVEIKNRIANKINRTRLDREKKIAKINNFVNPCFSYAEATNTQHTTQNKHQSQTIHDRLDADISYNTPYNLTKSNLGVKLSQNDVLNVNQNWKAIQTKIDKLENNIETINLRLDAIMNLFEKIVTQNNS